MKRGSFLKSLGALIVGVPLAQKVELPKDKEGFYIETDRVPVNYPPKDLLKYDPNGNVGIGTITPSANFTVTASTCSGWTAYYNLVTKKIEQI